MYHDYDSDSDSDGFELASGTLSQPAQRNYGQGTSTSSIRYSAGTANMQGTNTPGHVGFSNQGVTLGFQGQPSTLQGTRRSTDKRPGGRGLGRAQAKKKGASGWIGAMSKGPVHPVGRGTSIDVTHASNNQTGTSVWGASNKSSADWSLSENAQTSQFDRGDYSRGNRPGTSQNVLQTVSRTDSQSPRTDTFSSEPLNSGVNDVQGEEDWGADCQKEEYVVKRKVFKPNALLDFKSITEANPGVSPKWLASKLANKPLRPSDQEMKSILRRLEDLWQGNKDKSYVSRLLSGHYDHSVNPFVLCSLLFDNASDSRIAKTSTLSFFVMKEFEKWYKTNRGLVSAEEYISRDLQLQVFDSCTRNHMTLFEMAVQCFHLNFEGNEVFLQRVKAFLQDKKFKEAAVCVGKLGLQDYFTIEEIVLPLLLQDKLNLLEAYVWASPKHQQLLVQYLDFLCDMETNLELIIGSVKNVTGIKRDKFQKKIISKLAIRLQKLYKIPSDMCPNINNARGLGAIRYLLRKKYIEHGLGGGSWGDMVEQAVGDNLYLRHQLVEQLVAFNDTQEAAYWADFYNLPKQELPSAVLDCINTRKDAASAPSSNATSGYQGDEEEDWDSACFTEEEINSAYHQLTLPEEKIMMVDTLQLYNICMADITRPGSVVGIDSEWRPGFGGNISRVSLIQLATRDTIYLLDTLALDMIPEMSWSQFAECFFCTESVLKLGYGIESDLKMMMGSFPAMKEIMPRVKRFVNLETLAKQLVMADTVLIPFDDDDDNDSVPKPPSDDNDRPTKFAFSEKEERGLSELVRRCLGRPLNKSQQMSNWELRPLRKEQILYAALDAFVLVEIYDIFIKKIQNSQQDIDLEPKISMKWLKPSKNEKRRAKVRGDYRGKSQALPSRPAPVSLQPRTPRELHVVVDTMLQGLGKQLRSCGVDVMIPDANTGHETIAQIGLKENRIVLTSGLPYHMMCNMVGPHQCYRVDSEGARKQVQEVLQHFNIHVQQTDIFSRCQVCNGDVYITLPTGDMYELYLRKEELKNGPRCDAATNNQSEMSENRNICSSSEPDLSKFVSYGIDWSTVTTLGTNVSIQTETVHESMFQKVDMFYVCIKCGKVFWEGSHFERVCEQYSSILNLQNDTSDSVYNQIKLK